MAEPREFTVQGDDPDRDKVAQLAEQLVLTCLNSGYTADMWLKAISAATGSMIGQLANSAEGVDRLIQAAHRLISQNATVNFQVADTQAPQELNQVCRHPGTGLPYLRLTLPQLAALPEYSHTLPTSPPVGMRWRCRLRNGLWIVMECVGRCDNAPGRRTLVFERYRARVRAGRQQEGEQ